MKAGHLLQSVLSPGDEQHALQDDEVLDSLPLGEILRHSPKAAHFSAFLTGSPESHPQLSTSSSFIPSLGHALGMGPPPEPPHYNGELAIVEDFRTPSIRFSDLTDSWRWTCWNQGPVERAPLSPDLDAPPPQVAATKPIAPKGTHPQLEFNAPHQKVHVHLEDKSAEYPSGRVLWDADYDMGGTEYLKPKAKAIGGAVKEFHPMCPPKKGPAHWYELTVTRDDPTHHSEWPPQRPIEDFLGAQTVTTYRPDQDPEQTLFIVPPKPDHPGGGLIDMFKNFLSGSM